MLVPFYQKEDHIQKDLVIMPTSENLKLVGEILKT